MIKRAFDLPDAADIGFVSSLIACHYQGALVSIEDMYASSPGPYDPNPQLIVKLDEDHPYFDNFKEAEAIIKVSDEYEVSNLRLEYLSNLKRELSHLLRGYCPEGECRTYNTDAITKVLGTITLLEGDKDVLISLSRPEVVGVFHGNNTFDFVAEIVNLDLISQVYVFADWVKVRETLVTFGDVFYRDDTFHLFFNINDMDEWEYEEIQVVIITPDGRWLEPYRVKISELE